MARGRSGHVLFESLVALGVISVVLVPLVVEVVDLSRSRSSHVTDLELLRELRGVRDELHVRPTSSGWIVAGPAGIRWDPSDGDSPWYPLGDDGFRWRGTWSTDEGFDRLTLHGRLRGRSATVERLLVRP